MKQAFSAASTVRGPIATATRRRILTAARDLFAEHGYRSTSMRQLAARVGLTDPALYYHFNSKHDVLAALLSEATADGPAASCQSVAELVEYVACVFDQFAGDAQLFRILFREQLARGEDGLEFRARRVAHLRQELSPMMSELFGVEGAVRLRSIEYLLFGTLWDGIIGYGQEWSSVSGQDVFRVRTRRLVALVLGDPAFEPKSAGASWMPL